MIVKKGELEAFFETGTEGVCWSLNEHLPDPKNPQYESYEGLHVLKNGDRLKVYGEAKAVVWEGVVKLEYKRRWREFPNSPYGGGQQEIWGFWVHGFQDGLEPEAWARWFFDGYSAEFERP